MPNNSQQPFWNHFHKRAELTDKQRPVHKALILRDSLNGESVTTHHCQRNVQLSALSNIFLGLYNFP